MIETTSVPTYTATIYVGSRYNPTKEIVYDRSEIENIIQMYVDRVGLCVTLTDTQFIYTNGEEPGFAVGLINYPRFPASREDIRRKALELAELLLVWGTQMKVSVVFPDDTVMLSNPDVDAKH